jgi:hypothetical protein
LLEKGIWGSILHCLAAAMGQLALVAARLSTDEMKSFTTIGVSGLGSKLISIVVLVIFRDGKADSSTSVAVVSGCRNTYKRPFVGLAKTWKPYVQLVRYVRQLLGKRPKYRDSVNAIESYDLYCFVTHFFDFVGWFRRQNELGFANTHESRSNSSYWFWFATCSLSDCIQVTDLSGDPTMHFWR